MKARRSALELPAAAERWSVRSAAAAGPGQPSLQGPCPRGRIPVGPSVAPGRESEKVPRGLRACKHPAPRHTFSGLFSSFLLNSPCWSHTPGPSDRKFFLAALPKRRLSLQVAVSEQRTRGLRKGRGAPLRPPPGSRGAALRAEGPPSFPRWLSFGVWDLFPNREEAVDYPVPPIMYARNTHGPSKMSRGRAEPRHPDIRSRKGSLALPSPGLEFRTSAPARPHPQVRSPILGLGFPRSEGWRGDRGGRGQEAGRDSLRLGAKERAKGGALGGDPRPGAPGGKVGRGLAGPGGRAAPHPQRADGLACQESSVR